MRVVTLYTRPGCHLCEQARTLLAQIGRGPGIAVHEVAIDDDPALRQRYTDRVPVAAAGGQELDWPFTEAQVRKLLDGSPLA